MSVLQPRFQVWAENSLGEALPVGPMACEEFARRYLSVINKMIIEGKEVRMQKPHIRRVFPSTEYIDQEYN